MLLHMVFEEKFCSFSGSTFCLMKCLFNEMATPSDNILTKYQCGFRKGLCSQQCLILFVEKWGKNRDKGGSFATILTDLSKAFDCLLQDLLIAKLYAYGFDMASLKLIFT